MRGAHRAGAAMKRQDLLSLLCAGVLGASGVGFVIGLHANTRIRAVGMQTAVTPTERGSTDQDGHMGQDAHIILAPTYAELGTHPLGPNRQRHHRLVDAVAAEVAAVEAERDADPAARLAALQRRAQRRAYAGAPPVVPHTIVQRDPAACLVCHGHGQRIGALTAPRMSHQPYQNCQQCHVEARDINPAVDAALNAFIGAAECGPGPRAFTTAPPAMPHSTFMREDCLSCHGPLGAPALRTTHPERTNCQQCHAPAAHLEGWREPSETADGR